MFVARILPDLSPKDLFEEDAFGQTPWSIGTAGEGEVTNLSHTPCMLNYDILSIDLACICVIYSEFFLHGQGCPNDREIQIFRHRKLAINSGRQNIVSVD